MIERRVLLGAFAATVLVAPALAQLQTKETTAPMQDGGSKPSMGEAEMKHLKDTMAAGAMSLAAARLAVKNAQDEDVKQFATFEVAEQETIADALMMMMDPSKASGKMNIPSDSEVIQHVSKDDQAMLEKMKVMKSKEFDAAFVKAQTDGHQKLLRIQEDYLAAGKNPSHLAVTKLARGQIKEHLQILADLRDEDASDSKSKK